MREEYEAFVSAVGVLNVDTKEIGLKRQSDASITDKQEAEKEAKRKTR